MRAPMICALLLGMVLAPDANAQEDWRRLQALQIAQAHEAVEKYRDVAVAEDEGWRRGPVAPLMGEHWSLRKREALVAGYPIDFSRPHVLVYSEIAERRELIGVAYLVRLGPFDPLPQGFAGPDDKWHVHNVSQILNAIAEERPLIASLGRWWAERNITAGGRDRLAMVHLWLDGRSPDGWFTDRERSLPYRRIGLPDASWVDDAIEVGLGLGLAHPDGCEEELKGKLWLSGANWQTRQAAMATCQAFAEEVRMVLDQSEPEREAVAAAAYTGLWERLETMLSDDELRRIASLVESGCGAPKDKDS